jgi:two-component system sensor histidine kinase RegB
MKAPTSGGGAERRVARIFDVGSETSPSLAGHGGAAGRAGLADRLLVLSGIATGAPGRVRLHTVALTRWIAVVGQLVTILFVHAALGIALPLWALLPAVALAAAVNLALTLGLKATTRLPERSTAALFAFDILQLCYLVALTGGLQNPFAVLLLVPVALAAAALDLRSTMGVTALALFCVALLAVAAGPLPWRNGSLTLPPLYRVGGWAALSMAIVLIAVFAWSIAEEARQRAEALSATQLALAREQQLSALGGQAAAAAHLLGTPLATINVIAKELVRELPLGSPLAEEAAELLEQARRCRDLLAGLGKPSNDPLHQRFTRAPLSGLLEAVAEPFARPGIAVEVLVEPLDGTAEPHVDLTPELRHALANLIDNAIQFARSVVRIRVQPSHAALVLVIEDDGPGFPAEVLGWLGEPFLSTRREQGGSGLGIFIANTLLARTGAKVHFQNTEQGARVTLSWPSQYLERAFGELNHDGKRDQHVASRNTGSR